MFVDQAKIKIKAGDGGDGGKGGDIIFQVDDNFSTLIDFRYQRKYVAQRGENGGARNCTGRSAPDLIIRVPRGTVIRNAATGRIMADLSTDEPKVLAKGGRGGKGNIHFATSTRQIPRFAKPGFPGEEFEVTLELKLLADVGLVGYPNVGKSTLISVVSAAKPKIANYHFTTITPVLGVVRVAEEQSFVMADIPGLIEGASDGVGLGHEFLRHVERCRLIIHVVDASGMEGRDPIEDYETIQTELERFSEDLAKRPQLLAANKCDLATPEQIDRLKAYAAEKGIPFFPISAATTQGTAELVQATASRLAELPPILEFQPDPITPEELEQEASLHEKFDVAVEDGIYYVDAKWLEPILRTVNMEDYSSLQYFQRVLRNSGIIARLEEMGIQEGDTVDILGFEFDFVS